jgi:drug/metabolite transporter (DMT)-like permease
MSGARHGHNVQGVWAMVVAVASLSLMDGALKTLSPHYSPLQVTTVRALSALPVMITWVLASGGVGQLLRVRFPLHLLRALIAILMLSLFTYGIRHLPLSEAYTLFFVAPLLITALAALVLRERVDAGRWLAIGVGFAGVIIVLRPSGAGVLSLPGLAVLGTAVCYAISAITTRVLGRTDTSQSMVFWLMTMMAVGAGTLAWNDWRPIQPTHWRIIVAMALTGSIGQLAITEAFKRAEASLIAPLEYTALAWGIALDWFFWRTLPTARTLAGAAVIIASGIYLIRRERLPVAVSRA